MATEADLTTYLDAARVAISSSNLASARTNVALAKTVLAELADIGADGVTQRYSGSVGLLESAIHDLEYVARSARKNKIGRTRASGV